MYQSNIVAKIKTEKKNQNKNQLNQILVPIIAIQLKCKECDQRPCAIVHHFGCQIDATSDVIVGENVANHVEQIEHKHKDAVEPIARVTAASIARAKPERNQGQVQTQFATMSKIH